MSSVSRGSDFANTIFSRQHCTVLSQHQPLKIQWDGCEFQFSPEVIPNAFKRLRLMSHPLLFSISGLIFVFHFSISHRWLRHVLALNMRIWGKSFYDRMSWKPSLFHCGVTRRRLGKSRGKGNFVSYTHWLSGDSADFKSVPGLLMWFPVILESLSPSVAESTTSQLACWWFWF